MHIPLSQQQDQLLLSEIRVDQCQRDAVEAQVPGSIPGIFPGVGHRDHIGIVEVPPLMVASDLVRLWWRRSSGVTIQPLINIIIKNCLLHSRPANACLWTECASA